MSAAQLYTEGASTLDTAAVSVGMPALPLKGVRMGIYKAWFEDADPTVVGHCRAAVAQMEAHGAEGLTYFATLRVHYFAVAPTPLEQ
jgi:Asp-tRNA(Asn)/Glu-tRNA(Gln) amidotransferase A subunit family amidase